MTAMTIAHVADSCLSLHTQGFMRYDRLSLYNAFINDEARKHINEWYLSFALAPDLARCELWLMRLCVGGTV
jgi:hypothetical protein